MVKRFIIWLLFILLIIAATWEQIYISTSLKELKQRTFQLEKTINEEEITLNSINQAKSLEIFWKQKEKVLCLLINYKEIKEILCQIMRLKETMQQNDLENTYIELEVLKYNVLGSTNVIGFNVQNVL